MVAALIAFTRLSQNAPFFMLNAAPVRHQISANAAPESYHNLKLILSRMIGLRGAFDRIRILFLAAFS
jgi:hypothetical protein